MLPYVTMATTLLMQAPLAKLLDDENVGRLPPPPFPLPYGLCHGLTDARSLLC
jgi:hypothetical protein